jgi:hypothetical protein
VAGLIAMALAGAAALTVNEGPAAPQALQLSSLSSGLSGTDAVSDDADPRERAISRDSERQALQDAADARLSQVAEQKAVQRNAELQTLSRAAAARAGEIAANQWHLPTTGYRLTAGFGAGGGLWASDHTGLDFAAPSGTPIVAVANGVITETGSAGAYGNQTIQTLDRRRRRPAGHQRPADRHRREHRQQHWSPPAPRGAAQGRRPGRPGRGTRRPRRRSLSTSAFRASRPGRSAAAAV